MGIGGTPTSSGQLDVLSSNTSTSISSTAGAGISLRNTHATDNNYSFVRFDASNGNIGSGIFGITTDQTPTRGELSFATVGSGGFAERMRITSAGRVTVKKASNAEVTALTSSSASTAVDMDAANNFSLALAENTTLAQPTNITAGQSGAIVITQDVTGSRTMAYNAYWKFEGGTAPVLSTTGGQADTLAYYVASATSIHAVLLKNMS